MTTLAPAAEKTSSRPPLLPPFRRCIGAFKPSVGEVMADEPKGMSGSDGGSGGESYGSGRGADYDDGTHTPNGRLKRELEPGGSQHPPPAKRMSPIPLRPHERAFAGQDPEPWRLDSCMPGEPCAPHAGPSAGFDDAATRCGRAWQSSPIRRENGGSGGGGGGGGSGDGVANGNAHSLPQIRESALTIGRAHTASPGKGSSSSSSATPAPFGVKLTRAHTTHSERPLSPPQLWEKAVSVGDLLHRPSPIPTYGFGASVQKSRSPSPLMMGASRRDILKPAPAKQNAVLASDSAGGGSLGNSCRTMKRPLGGGLRASSSWDGGCASSAPPGSGGGFSAVPACRSCGGGGGGHGNGSGNGSAVDEDASDSTDCVCRGVRQASATGLSPLPFARATSTESGGGQESRRHGEDDMFADHMLSHALSLPSSPSAGPQSSGGARGGEGSGSVSGAGSGGAEVEDLHMLIPDMHNHDIEDCMRTLQASPTHPGSHQDHGGPSLHPPLGFDISSFDGSGNHDVPQVTLSGSGESGSAGAGADMDIEASSPPGRGDDGGRDAAEAGNQDARLSSGSEGGPRVGDNHQAVIPSLSCGVDGGSARLSPDRPPPLQLWRSGMFSRQALDVAFPRPRREGAGSADLEQKMLSAFLLARADETVRRASPTSREAAGVSEVPASRGANGDDGNGAGGDSVRADDADSLQSLAAFVAAGEGSRWKSDWPEKDHAAFRRGVYAFRRDFHRVRAAFLPHKAYGDVVDYFYRRWKRHPEYPVWKDTDQLVGRRIAKRVEVTEMRQGVGLAKRLEAIGMRRGWVVRKDLSSSLEQMFVVRFPAMGIFQVKFETVDLGTLETMLVEGSASEEERASEARDGARIAHSRGDIPGAVNGAGGGGVGTGAWSSLARGSAYDSDRSGGVGGGGSGSGAGGSSAHLDLRPATHHAVRGRRLAWQPGSDSVDYEDEEEDTRDENQGPPSSPLPVAAAATAAAGGGVGAVASARPGSGVGDWTVARDPASGVQTEEEEDDEEEDEGETEEADVDGGGTSDSISGPDAETDSTTSLGAAVSTPGDNGKLLGRANGHHTGTDARITGRSPSTGSRSISPHKLLVSSEPSLPHEAEIEQQQQQQQPTPAMEELVDTRWDLQQRPPALDESIRRASTR